MGRYKDNGGKFTGYNGLKYDTVAEFEEVVEDYFVTAEEAGRPLTVPSLAVHLEIGIETLMKYGARDRYGNIVKRALDRIEAWTAEASYDRQMVQGAKLNLDVYRNRIMREGQRSSGSNSELLDALLDRKAALLAKAETLALARGVDTRTEAPEVVDGEVVYSVENEEGGDVER